MQDQSPRRTVQAYVPAVPQDAVDWESAGVEELVLRFARTERRIHWAIAAPFVVCWLSAVVLILFYNPTGWQAARQWFSLTHRIAGALLFALPVLVIVTDRKDWRLHLANIRQAWIWSYRDVRWLVCMGLSTVFRRVRLPEQGKFNAAEKLNFMTVMTTWPFFVVTGFLLWLPGAMLGAWWVHLGLAALVTPLMLGHIYMATVNPDTRVGLGGMIHGRVDREWARHHYGAWYREEFEAVPPVAEAEAEAAPTEAREAG